MPYGYLGQNQPNQTVSNSGVFSITDVAELQSQGKLGGSLELIEEQTVTSSTATIDFTNIQGAKYDVHYMTINGFEVISGGQTVVLIRYSTDGGSSYVSSGYQNAYQQGTTSGSFSELRSTSSSSLEVGYTNGTEQCSGYVYLYNLNNSSKYSFNTFQNIQENGVMNFGGGVYSTANTVNAIRILSGVNIDNAVVKLYGVKQI